jgi:hypothetical protein
MPIENIVEGISPSLVMRGIAKNYRILDSGCDGTRQTEIFQNIAYQGGRRLRERL